MRAYILTIDGQPRNDGLIGSCEAAGIPVEVVIGVRGSALTDVEVRERYDERASVFTLDRPMGRGEIGCALGHRQIVEHFLATGGDDWAVVLEDDAQVGDHLRAARDLVAELPDEPIVLTFVPGRTGAYADRLHRSQSCVQASGISAVRLDDPPDLNTGYAINRRAAQVADRAYRGRRIDSVADWPYRWARRVQFWRIDPPLVHPMGAESLIHDDRSALQSAARKRIDPSTRKFILGIAGIRLVQGMVHGYAPSLVWRQDVLPYARHLRGRR